MEATMTTRTHTYLTAAARRARNEAEQFSSSGEGSAAELLLAEIKETERLLRTAAAVIRQTFRPLSVSGYGESMDSLRDTVDGLHLAVDRIGDIRTRARVHLELVGGDDDGA
jgi:hypothetical protein